MAYYNRGVAKGKLGDAIGEVQEYSKAIELNPKFAIAYFSRGTCKYSLRDKKGACLDWSKAGELGYEDAYDNISKYCK
ncbi:MAG: tetratricopeptide repeat protein [Bacteroidia bacterium]